MKINSQHPGHSAPVSHGKGSKGADKASEASASGQLVQSDSVEKNSSFAGVPMTYGDGTFDAKKVEEIKAAIAEGKFKVDPSKIADGLISSVQDFLKKG